MESGAENVSSYLYELAKNVCLILAHLSFLWNILTFSQQGFVEQNLLVDTDHCGGNLRRER